VVVRIHSTAPSLLGSTGLPQGSAFSPIKQRFVREPPEVGSSGRSSGFISPEGAARKSGDPLALKYEKEFLEDVEKREWQVQEYEEMMRKWDSARAK
jgi:hypothetical protein